MTLNDFATHVCNRLPPLAIGKIGRGATTPTRRVTQPAFADGGESAFSITCRRRPNLLGLYTEPGDTVIDPFASGGTTIMTAKVR
ncbi:MAG: hypothetical protein ACREE2_10580 [Stellaceae bacterium]